MFAIGYVFEIKTVSVQSWIKSNHPTLSGIVNLNINIYSFPGSNRFELTTNFPKRAEISFFFLLGLVQNWVLNLYDLTIQLT